MLLLSLVVQGTNIYEEIWPITLVYVELCHSLPRIVVWATNCGILLANCCGHISKCTPTKSHQSKDRLLLLALVTHKHTHTPWKLNHLSVLIMKKENYWKNSHSLFYHKKSKIIGNFLSVSLWFVAHPEEQFLPLEWIVSPMWCLWKMDRFTQGDTSTTHLDLLSIILRYLLDLVVTEQVKTWTQGIVGAQWNESNRCVAECFLQTQTIHQWHYSGKGNVQICDH